MQSVGLESDPVEAIAGALAAGADVDGGVSGVSGGGSDDVSGDASGHVSTDSTSDVRAAAPAAATAGEPLLEETTQMGDPPRCKQVKLKSEPVILIDKVERCLVVEWFENEIRREQRISYKKYGNDKAKVRAKELIEKLKAGITFEQLYPDKGPPIVRVYKDVGIYRVSLIRDRTEREWRVEWTDNETPMKARWSCKKVGNNEAKQRAETFAQSMIEGVFNPILLHKATGTRFSRSDRTVVKINVYMKKNVKRKNKCKMLRGGDKPPLVKGKAIKNGFRRGKMKHVSDTVDGSLVEGSDALNRNETYSGTPLSNFFLQNEGATLDGRTDANYGGRTEEEDAKVATPEESYLLSEYHLGGGMPMKKRHYKPRGKGAKGERMKKTPKEGSKLKGKMAHRVKDSTRGAMGGPAEEGLAGECLADEFLAGECGAAQTNGPAELDLFSCCAELGNVDPPPFSSNSNHLKNEPDRCDPLSMPYSDNGGGIFNCNKSGAQEVGGMTSGYLFPCEQYEGYRAGGDYSRYAYAARSAAHAVYVNYGVQHGALHYGGERYGGLQRGDLQRGDLHRGDVPAFHYGGEDPFARSHTTRSEYLPGGGALPAGHYASGAVLRGERYPPYMVSYGGGMAPHMGEMHRGVASVAMHRGATAEAMQRDGFFHRRDEPNGGSFRDVVGDPQGGGLLPQKSHIKSRKHVRQRICHLKKIKREAGGNDVEGKDPHKGGERSKGTKCLPVGGSGIMGVGGISGVGGVGDPPPASHKAERKKRKRSANRNFKGEDFLLDEELSKYFSTYQKVQLRKNQKALRNQLNGVMGHVVGDSMGVCRGRRYNHITGDVCGEKTTTTVVHGGGAHLRALSQQELGGGQDGTYGHSEVVPTVKRSSSVDANKNDNVLMNARVIPLENAGGDLLTEEAATKPRRRTKHCRFSRASQSALSRVDTINQKEDSLYYGNANGMMASYRMFKADGERDASACGAFGSYAVGNMAGMLVSDSGFAPQLSNHHEGSSGDVMNDRTEGDSSAGGLLPSGLHYGAEQQGSIGVDCGGNAGELVDPSRSDAAEGKTHLMNLRRARRRSTPMSSDHPVGSDHPVSSDHPSEVLKKDISNCPPVRNSTIEFVDNPRGYRVPYEYQSQVFYEHFEVPLNSQKEFELQQRYFACLFSLHILAVGWNTNKNARVEDYMQELSDPAFRLLAMGGVDSCGDAPRHDGSPASEKGRQSGQLEGRLTVLNRGELQNGGFLTSNRLANETSGADYCYFNPAGGTAGGSLINDALNEAHQLGPPGGEQEVGGMSKYECEHLMSGPHGGGGLSGFGGVSSLGGLAGPGYACAQGVGGMGGPYSACMMGSINGTVNAAVNVAVNAAVNVEVNAAVNAAVGVDYQLGSAHGKDAAACLNGVDSNPSGVNGACANSGEGMNDVRGANAEGLMLPNVNYPNGLNSTHLHGEHMVNPSMHSNGNMPYDHEGERNLEYTQNYMYKVNPLNMSNVDEASYEHPLSRDTALPFHKEVTMVNGSPWEGREENEAAFDAANTEVANHYNGFTNQANHIPMVGAQGEEGCYPNLQSSMGKNSELDALAACGRDDNPYGVGSVEYDEVPIGGRRDVASGGQCSLGDTSYVESADLCVRKGGAFEMVGEVHHGQGEQSPVRQPPVREVPANEYDLVTIGEKDAPPQRMGYINLPYDRGDALNGDKLNSEVMEEHAEGTGKGDYLYYSGYSHADNGTGMPERDLHNCGEEANYNTVAKSNDECSSGSPHGNGEYSVHDKPHYEFGHMLQVFPNYEQLQREGSCQDNVVDRQAQSQFGDAHYRFGVCSAGAQPPTGEVVPGQQHADELSGSGSQNGSPSGSHSGSQNGSHMGSHRDSRNTTPNSYDDVAYNSYFKKAKLTSTSISTPLTNMKDMNSYEYFASRKMIDKLRSTSNSSTINTEYLPSNLLNSISMNNVCLSNNVNEQGQK
ncbi:transcription factor with AP2 domain(s), putative [Plasmodium vivax]|uniref:Transcription factor with AP2 domain(S), putative n=1 Tax=Plasmodium vivax TaxID=5855 RepID=A0A1G4HFW4_PLAVI|nr:transcription factor with AP2 domain(s), putative [Plasmodium vivax]